jgi:hypothetical protein
MENAESRGKAFGSCDPSSLYYHISQVRHEMGDVHGSIAAMRQADALQDSVFRRGRVRQRATLAERQLRVGHLEAAYATWHQALDDYPLVQSGRADQRIQSMLQLIKPHLKNYAARDLNDRARMVVPASLHV